MEAEGGIVASLSVGKLQRRIELTREARTKAVATRREPLTGASEFPNLRREAGHGSRRAARVGAPARLAISVRAAAVACDAAARPSASRNPTRPCATPRTPILAKTGAPAGRCSWPISARVAAFNARATFAANALAAGGLESLSNEGFPDADGGGGGVPGFGRQRSPASARPTRSTPSAPSRRRRPSREAGAGPIYLAGKPADLI
ncbi:methylmalonyl-CoA mutase family protein [Methylobacterium oryzae CBMB20]